MSRRRGGHVPRTRALVALLPLALVGCTSSTETPSSPGTSLVTPSPSVPSLVSTPSGTTPSPSRDDASTGTRPFGPGCSRILGDDEADVERLSASDVVDALSQSPTLTRLGRAVEEAGLVQELEGEDGATLLAPDDEAFSRLGRADAARLLGDRSTLVRVVRTHVLPERLGPEELVGRHQALSGATVEVTGSGTDLTVDGDARVVCGNIRTSNATIYVIDRVLVPR